MQLTHLIIGDEQIGAIQGVDEAEAESALALALSHNILSVRIHCPLPLFPSRL